MLVLPILLILTKKDDEGAKPSGGETTWKNPERHDLAEDSTKQVNLKYECYHKKKKIVHIAHTLTVQRCPCLVDDIKTHSARAARESDGHSTSATTSSHLLPMPHMCLCVWNSDTGPN